MPDSVMPGPRSADHVCTHCGFPVRKAAGPAPHFCCYGCAFAHQILKDSPDGKQVSWILVQLGVAAFLAMNVMGFSLALHASSVYADFYERMSQPGRVLDELMRYLLLLMSAPVLVLAGVPLLENVIREARQKRWGVEGFIAASVLAAFAYSMVSTLRGRGPIYFDIAVMVLVFLTLGRYLEARFRFRAARSLEKLLDEEGVRAQRLVGDSERTVRAEDLSVGDVIVLRAGDRVPADAIVLSGSAVLELAPMTGESIPVHKKEGQTVWSGSTLSEGFIRAEVTHLSRESWAAALRGTVEAAKRSKAQVEQMAQRLIGILTWVTLACAAAAFVMGYAAQGWMAGLMRCLSVLVIVCPCALGAAIPLALWRSYEMIVRRGIFFKDLSLLESLSKVRGVFFDKTGTLTGGTPVLSAIERHSELPTEELLTVASSLAQVSAHPFSRAVRSAAAEKELAVRPVEGLTTAVGLGLSGTVHPYGQAVMGSVEYLRSRGMADPLLDGARTAAAGRGSIHLGLNGRVAARFDFSEDLRKQAKSLVSSLKRSGYAVGILTGDQASSADAIGRELGIDVVKGLSPAQKLSWIREWERRNGPTLVVGEGLNDAPMLAGASVSLAMGCALARTRDAADFGLPDDDLSGIEWLLLTSRRTLERIRLNLFWAFIYNALAVPLAVMGKVNPIIAAMAMIVSSASIILHSLKSEKGVS